MLNEQTNNRIREECSVDYNLSPQITEVAENCKREILELFTGNPIDCDTEGIIKLDRIIDELLKSQEHKLREELVERIENKISEYNKACIGDDKILGLRQALSLIKDK